MIISFQKNQNKLIRKIIIIFVNCKIRMTINNIKLNTYILIKNSQMIITLYNIMILNQIKIYSNIIIYIIEIMNHKYHNKAVKYIKLNFDKKILIDILINLRNILPLKNIID